VPLPALPLGRSGAKKLLFYAESPVKLAIFKPLLRALFGDSRIELYFAGKLQGSVGSKGMAELLGLDGIKTIRRGWSALHRFDLLVTADYEIWAPYENPLLPASRVPKLQLFHGASVRNGAVAPKMKRFQHWFVIGPYMERALIANGYVRADDPGLHRVGMPKTDRLLDGSLDRAAITQGLRIDPRRKTVMLAPTWMKPSPLDEYGDALLDGLARGPWNLLIKLHDKFFDPRFNVTDWAAKLAPFDARENVRVVRDYDAVPAMFASDLLISDVSSIANEFALLDRPLVYLRVPDEDKLRGRYRHMDLDTWGQRAGENAGSAAECVAAVERSLAHPELHRDVRRALAQDIFFHPGQATRAAVDAVYGILGLSPPLIHGRRGQATGC
jgi:hypothetical protein